MLHTLLWTAFVPTAAATSANRIFHSTSSRYVIGLPRGCSSFCNTCRIPYEARPAQQLKMRQQWASGSSGWCAAIRAPASTAPMYNQPNCGVSRSIGCAMSLSLAGKTKHSFRPCQELREVTLKDEGRTALGPCIDCTSSCMQHCNGIAV